MRANHRLGRRGLVLLAVMLAGPIQEAAAEQMYLVEVLVFRHAYADQEAVEVEAMRGFHELLQLDGTALPEVPRRTAQVGTTFQSLWNRLRRLDAYEPLALLSFAQSRIDYHPPVRLHNVDEIAEELHFPGNVVYVDLAADDMFAPFVLPLYRLDGSVQLRRSRFLHLEFDLEFRIDDPGWLDAGSADDAGLGDQLGILGAPEGVSQQGPDGEPGSIFEVLDSVEAESEPFRVHRLRQSRQVKTDTMHYFDTAYLGAIARITSIDGD